MPIAGAARDSGEIGDFWFLVVSVQAFSRVGMQDSVPNILYRIQSVCARILPKDTPVGSSLDMR